MGGLINLAKMMVSFHLKTRMQSGKAHYNKLEVIQERIKNKSELSAGE